MGLRLAQDDLSLPTPALVSSLLGTLGISEGGKGNSLGKGQGGIRECFRRERACVFPSLSHPNDPQESQRGGHPHARGGAQDH